jgi:hypothetical protein
MANSTNQKIQKDIQWLGNLVKEIKEKPEEWSSPQQLVNILEGVIVSMEHDTNKVPQRQRRKNG